jgi:hypothetical protein
MSLTAGDALTAYSFTFSIDGQTIPNVVEVNNITKGTSTIETQSMTPDGTYVLAQMLGPRQSGTLTVTSPAPGRPEPWSTRTPWASQF